ncbi:MAG TPA: anti-sigma factor [Mycobacteriales bacterium]|nr:anti-sigma factor [Mycobacteriales bacterium]
MTEHIQWEELAVGHAFSALEPEDEQAFLTHLRGCGLCERTLAETDAVASHLAYAAEPADPPAALREAILDAVRESGRPVRFPAKVTPLRSSTRPHLAAARTVRSPYRSALALAGVAAGLVAIVSVGVWNTNLRANIEVKNAAIARMEQVSEIAADPTTVRVPLTSGDVAGGTAFVRGSTAVVLVRGLPANAPNSTYVLWYRDKQGGFHAVNTFDVRETDHVNIVDSALDRPIDQIASIAVSREPGRTAPATPSFALVQGSVGR